MRRKRMIGFFDMFAGVGGFRAGLERAGGYKCVGHCEIDKHAERAYRAVHNVKKGEVFYEDATTIDTNTMPRFDLLCAGFPCQAFSIAGRRQGFLDPRGTLFFEIARVARARQPAYLLLENVPGLLSHDQGRTFAAILDTLCELGYGVEWQVLDSKDFGVPQQRRRVYIVGYLDRGCAGKVLPVRETNAKALIRLIGGRQDSRVYDPKGLSKTLLAKSGGPGGKTGLYFVDLSAKSPRITPGARCLTARYDRGISQRPAESSGVLDTKERVEVHAVLTPDREKIRQHGRRIKETGEPMYTLTAQDRHGVLLIKEATERGYKEAAPGDSVDLSYASLNTRRGRVGTGIAHTLNIGGAQGVVTLCGRIRRLMPRECFRLQGFTDERIDKLLENTSDTQAYKMAGNAVTVNVVHALGLRLKAAHKGNAAKTRARKEAA
jgi:DNA (cytosine-5)-methyltransferase 1